MAQRQKILDGILIGLLGLSFIYIIELKKEVAQIKEICNPDMGQIHASRIMVGPKDSSAAIQLMTDSDGNGTILINNKNGDSAEALKLMHVGDTSTIEVDNLFYRIEGAPVSYPKK